MPTTEKTSFHWHPGTAPLTILGEEPNVFDVTSLTAVYQVQDQDQQPKPGRRLFQISLRFSIFLLLVCSAIFAWLSNSATRAKRERAVVEKLMCMQFAYDYEIDIEIPYVRLDTEPPGPRWLTRIFDAQMFARVARLERPNMDKHQFFESIGELKGLQELQFMLPPDSSIEDLDFLGDLEQLHRLEFHGTTLTDVSALKNLTNLVHLKIDSVSATDFDCLYQLTKLKSLEMHHADGVTNTDWLENMPELEELKILWGRNVETTSADNMAHLTNIKELGLDNWTKLADVKGLKNLTRVEMLNLKSCYALKSLDGIQGMTKLRELWIPYCRSLDDFSALQSLPQIERIECDSCSLLTNLDDFSNTTSLKHLTLDQCNALTCIDGIGNLPKLRSLRLTQCEQVKNLAPLLSLPDLKDL